MTTNPYSVEDAGKMLEFIKGKSGWRGVDVISAFAKEYNLNLKWSKKLFINMIEIDDLCIENILGDFLLHRLK